MAGRDEAGNEQQEDNSEEERSKKQGKEQQLSPLVRVSAKDLGVEELNAVAEEIDLYPGWSKLEFTVDSGATETVMGLAQLAKIRVRRSRTSHGALYEVANGGIIENEGERCFTGVSYRDERDAVGVSRVVTAQVTSVNKALLSVARLEAAGYEVKFGGKGGSWIRDAKTGEKMMLEKRRGSYILTLWVKDPEVGDENRAQGFARQAAGK